MNASLFERSALVEAPSIFVAGQAGYILRNKEGGLLGIDLCLSDYVERYEGHIGFKRLIPKLIDPYELELDVVIATHVHADHFDVDSMPTLMREGRTLLLASEGCADSVRQVLGGRSNFCLVCAGDEHTVSGFVVTFVTCDHGEAAPDAVGALVSFDGLRVLFVGDTCLRLDWVDRYIAEGPIDVMVAPINGAFGNMSEIDCAKLAAAVQPSLTVPSHYGMFASHGGSPKMFMKAMAEHAPFCPYALLAYGETLCLGRPDNR